jgi:hypothetical protein
MLLLPQGLPPVILLQFITRAIICLLIKDE